MSASIIRGVDSAGTLRTVLVNTDGSLVGGGGGGGGTTGGATEITLAEVRDKLESLKTFTDGLETLLASGNTTASALNAFVDQLEAYTDGIEANQAIQIARTPTLGAATSANSIPVTLSTDGQFAASFGSIDSPPASTDTGSFNLLAFFKRFLGVKLPSALIKDRFKTDSLVRSVSRKWREDFAGTTLDPTAWTVVQTGAGQSISVAASTLSIASGTTANSETIIRSVEKFTISFRTWFIANLTQRIANQEFYLEIVDASGGHYASWLFDGTGGSGAKQLSANTGNSLGATPAIIATSSAYQIFEIETFPDEVNWFIRSPDSVLARNASSSTRTRQIPDPNLEYYVQIRVKNLATAPASSTILNIDAITVQDIEELTTEITGGRGGINANQAIPTSVTNAVAISGNISTTIVSGADSFVSVADFISAFAVNQSITASVRDSTLQRNAVRGSLTTDQLGTITIEQSFDAVTYIQTHVFIPSSIPAIQAYLFEFKMYRRYYRVKYTNGSIASTTMNLVTSMFAVGSS